MKKFLFPFLLFFSSISFAAVCGQFAHNPVTGELDCVGTGGGGGITTLSTLTPGATTFIFNQNTLQSGATFYVSNGTVDGTLTANTQLSAVNNGFSVAAGDYGAGSIQAGVSGWAGQFSTQYPFSVLGSFSGHNGHAMQIKDTRAPGYGNVLLDFKYNNDSILTQQGGGALNAFADAQGEHFQIIAGSGNILLLDPSNVVLNRQLLVSTINVTSQFLANGSAGTSGQLLKSNGTSAAPSWTAAASGSPGGATGQLQYNNGGLFGGIAGSTISTSGTIVAIQSQHAADIPISITGAPSQSGYLLKTADSSGNLLTVIDSVGDLTLSKYLNGASDLYMSSTLVGGYGGFWIGHDNTTATGGNYALLGNASTTLFNGAPDVEFRGNNLTGLILHNDGSVTRSVFGYAPTSASGDSTSDVSIIPFNSAYKGLVIRGASSQSANLQEWQDNSTNPLSTIPSDGGVAPWPRTKVQLKALTPIVAGEMYYCSDCSTDGIVVSTGTAAGAVARISARTTVIN